MLSRKTFQIFLLLLCVKLLFSKNFDVLEDSQKNGYGSKCDEWQLPKRRIVCFYRVEEELRPYDLDPCLCTHIIYSYVAVRENFAFIAGKKGDLKFLAALKRHNPNLQILVSLRPSGSQFSLEETAKPNATALTVRTKFARRLREFITRHGLDGVDLDWEYFKEPHKLTSRRETLISVLRTLYNELKPLNRSPEDIPYSLTITTSKFARDLTDYYDFAEIYKYVNFVNVPTFNFDTQGKAVIHPSRLHGISDMENMDSMIDLALALGLPQEQLVVGVPSHGTLYRLSNTSLTAPGSPAIPWNYEEAIISHSKICAVRDNSNWTLVREKDLTAPYIYYKDKWIGFDDEISIKLKAKYIVLRQVGGIAFWSVNDDDPTGKCGYGPYPLLQSVRSVLLKPVDNINYLKPNTTINSITQSGGQYGNLADSSFVAVIEKYGNVERVVGDEPENSLLTCSHTGYIRHPQDCSRFYRCIKFDQNDQNPERFQYSCPIGLVFDERYELCNWPSWSPTCVGSGEIVHVNRKRFVCPSYGYFQDPENCEYFYYCSDFGKGYFQPYEFKCPFELAFDEEKLLCNWKWLVRGCGNINPEDRIVKDLSQILNQNAGALALESTDDKLLERSDILDADQSEPLLYSDAVDQQSDANRRQTSRIKKITQYMTKWVEDLGNKLKSFWNSKSESRNDKPDSGWFSQLNHFIPKFQRKHQNVNSRNNANNRKGSTRQTAKPRRPYHLSDQFISIPIVEIRPEPQLGHNFNRKPSQVQQKNQPNAQPIQISTSQPSRDKLQPNRAQLSANRAQDKDLSQTLSAGRKSPKLQDIVPMPLITVKNKNGHEERIPEAYGLPFDYYSPTDQLSKSSTAAPQKTSRLPFLAASGTRTALNKLNIFHKEKTSPKARLHFPTAQPLIIETLEEIQIPQYLAPQISLQPIPGPKKSNIRDQQQRYLGGIDVQKEVLHFSPEELNLENVKIETKARKPSEHAGEFDQKLVKSIRSNQKEENKKKLAQKPSHSHSSYVDTKLLDSNPLSLLHLSLPAINSKYEFKLPEDIQIEEVHTNVHKDGVRPEVFKGQQTGKAQPQVHYVSKDTQQTKKSPEIQIQDWATFSEEISQLPQSPKIVTQLSHSEERSRQQPNQKQIQQVRQRNPQQSQSQPQHSHQRNPPQIQTSQQQRNSQKHSASQQSKVHYSEQQRPHQQNHQQHAQQLSKPNSQQHLTQQVPQTKQQRPEQQKLVQQTSEKLSKQKPQQEAWSQPHNSHVTSKPQSIIYWPNIQDFEAVKTTKKPFSHSVQNSYSYSVETQETKQSNSEQHISDSALHSNGNKQNDIRNIDTFYEINLSNKPKTTESSFTSQKKISDHLDASATNNEHYASYYDTNQKLNSYTNKISSTQTSHTRNQALSPKHTVHFKDSDDQAQKSQLLIIPVPDEYSDAKKYSNLERLTKDYPKLFPDSIANTKLSHQINSHNNEEVLLQRTTARPRVIFSSPPTASPSLLNDEYIMLMLNNEDHLANKDNSSSAPIHELFKKTDGKLYNLETDSSKTLVALVPKSSYQTTQRPIKPIVYESIRPNVVSLNVTQPPVVIKLEIPRTKSNVFHSIVQQVKDEWMGSPYFPYQTLSPYNQWTRNDYKSYAIAGAETTTTPKPFISVTQQTIHLASTVSTTEAPEIGSVVPASIYDSIHQMISQNQWSQRNSGRLESLETTTSAPNIVPSQQKVTTQTSVILEHIPLYNGYNVVNQSYSSWQYATPWYQQLPAYQAANPYQQPPYPQTQIQYYPIASGYPQQPSQGQQQSHGFQPQFLSPNLTSNHWYDSYSSEAPITETTVEYEPSSSTFATTESTTDYTTTTIPTTTTSATTQQPTPKARRPSLSRRTTTRKPKTSTLPPIEDKYPVNEYINQNTATDKSIDLQRTQMYQNGDKPQIQVFIVQGQNGPQFVQPKPISHQSDVSDQPDVKDVYVDNAKNDQHSRYSHSNKKEELPASQPDHYIPHYEQNNENLPNNREQKQSSQQSHNPFDRYEYQLGPEAQNFDSGYNLKVQGANDDQYSHGVEHHSNKDIEYEDEPQISLQPDNMQSMKPQHHQYLPASKVQSLQNIYNSNAHPGLRNFTDGSVPESACTRPGLFQHPNDCNKYYECYWDKYINKFTLHSFECPVKLAFDSRIVGCSAPNDPTICVQY